MSRERENARARALRAARVVTLGLAAVSLPSCGAGSDSGTDSGGVVDSGASVDAGAPVDAGASVDAGDPVDASDPVDSGTGSDSGATPDGGGTDSGPLPMDDGGPRASLPLAMTSAGPADFSCMGMAPMGGANATFTAHVYDFQAGVVSEVPMIDVDVFPDDVVVDGCTGTCTTVTTNAMGRVMMTAPRGGWFAYRVHAGTGVGMMVPVLTIGYDRTAPMAAGVIELPSVASGTFSLIPSIYRRTRVAGTAMIEGSLTDCMGDEVSNAQLHVFRGATEILPGPATTDFFIGYFNGAGLPSATRTTTNTDGIYIAANAEPGDPVRVELWATIVAGAAAERVACEEVRLSANAATIISAGPERSDYAAGSGCL